MRFMTIVKTRETGARPSPALIEKIGKLGEEAAKQGKMVGMGDWARPSGLAPGWPTARSP
jgi:hypothetical protein